MDKLYEYQNGNTKVTIYSDGTKVREYEDTPYIDHPESLDCKISNSCNLGCPYCHENSTIHGKHADLQKLLDVLSVLPPGVELAIGGGNPLVHPQILSFLEELKKRGIIPNITVNQKHLDEYYDLLVHLITNKLVYGVGISIVNEDFTKIQQLKRITNNIVYHVIAGINNVSVIDKLIELGNCKVLVLGYKSFGRGIAYYSPDVDVKLLEWQTHLPRYIGKCVLSFDNLAIEQLKIRRLFTREGWERFYMGDDFTFTMYIDAVEQTYAPTSRSDERVSFEDCTLLEYFKM